MKFYRSIVKLLYCSIVFIAAILLVDPNGCKAEEPAENPIVETGHLIINEVFPGTENLDYADQFIELFNPTAGAIQLTGYTISRKSGSVVDMAQFTEIGSEQYLVLYKSTNITQAPNNVFTFRLNYASEDTVTLKFMEETIIDSVTFNLNEYRGKSVSRVPDGAARDLAKDVQVSVPTPGEKNIKYETPVVDDGKGGQEQVSIMSAREKDGGEKVTITGTVSVLPNVLSSQYFYIQDETGGMQIYSYRKAFPEMQVGDFVQVYGELSEVSGERRLKIKDESDITVLSSGTPPLPKEAEIKDVGESLEGQYVKITGTVAETSGDTFVVEDNEKRRVKIIIKSVTNIKKPKMHKGDEVEISGVVSQYKDDYRILPISQNDVKILADQSTDPLPLSGPENYLPILLASLTIIVWKLFQKAKKKLMSWPMKPQPTFFQVT